MAQVQLSHEGCVTEGCAPVSSAGSMVGYKSLGQQEPPVFVC